MGFVMSYRFGAPADSDPVDLLSRLRQASLQLPGSTASPVLRSGPSWSDPRTRRAEILAIREVAVMSLPAESFTYSAEVEPMELVAFWIQPGERCEQAVFGLARYPATVFDPQSGVQVPTQLGSGWHWSARFSAEDALALGVLHFVSCHLAVASLLQMAAELGCPAAVVDETGFWQTHDVAALASLAAERCSAPDDFEQRLALAIEESDYATHPGRVHALAVCLRAISAVGRERSDLESWDVDAKAPA
jgi:hypothetical protein